MTSESDEEEMMEEISENFDSKIVGSDQVEISPKIAVRSQNSQRIRKPGDGVPRTLSLKRNDPDEKSKKYPSAPPAKV